MRNPGAPVLLAEGERRPRGRRLDNPDRLRGEMRSPEHVRKKSDAEG